MSGKTNKNNSREDMPNTGDSLPHTLKARKPGTADTPFSSNSVRLSPGEWIAAGIVILALFYFGPSVWKQWEEFDPEADYRLPYKLSSDYWLYSRYCQRAKPKYETFEVGDSVVWGHYVSKHNTLSHYLNEMAGQNDFANLGVDGIHPAALAGLLKYYGDHITDKTVLLHFNPLWLSSKKHDLQVKKEFHFNHPELVPQFIPDIPCYKASLSRRISAVVKRYIPLLSWTSHLKKACFDNMDLPTWTLKHPYRNPARAITLRLPKSGYYDKTGDRSWTERGITKRDIPWVDLDTSFQWRFFQNSVETLRARNNKVFVLVGPFNEHLLKAKSLAAYENIKRKAAAWLEKHNVPYYMPPPLPSELYCDASHPSSEGYEFLSKQLFKAMREDSQKTAAADGNKE